MSSWIKRPFVIAAGLGLAVLLVAAALPLLHLGQPGGGPRPTRGGPTPPTPTCRGRCAHWATAARRSSA